MSTETEGLTGFLKALSRDTELKKRLHSAVEDVPETAVEHTVVQFAAQSGFDVNTEDLDRLRNELAEVSEGGLSDESLDQVSGGFLGATVSLARRVSGMGEDPSYHDPGNRKFWLGV